MKCPVCKDVNLSLAERQGIEIDYCPECRGIWLDRGELDRLIERAAREEQAVSTGRHELHGDPERGRYEQERSRHEHERGRYEHPQQRHHDHRRRKSWLGDILDFD